MLARRSFIRLRTPSPPALDHAAEAQPGRGGAGPGKTGRVTGELVALLTVMKGLPLAYAKDMQEDKEPVFDAADAWALSLAAIAGWCAT